MKFKNWLQEEAPSTELLNAYIRKISEETWLSKAQVKTARWILFSTIGTILGGEIGGTADLGASLAIDFFDDLILDRLLNNWKPNQFVDGDYKDFLNLRHEL